MYLNSFLYRFRKTINLILRKPFILTKIFNPKKLVRGIKQLFNVQVSFNMLNKNYQINILFDTLRKINNILNNEFNKKKFFINKKIENIEELEKKYIDNLKCRKLMDLFNKYGSDKTNSLMVYVYFDIFKKFKINSLFEIGLGTNNLGVRSNMGLDGKPGASLRAFRDYLNINVYGADVDKKILFVEDKIKTYFVDQLTVGSICSIKKLIPKCDLIIDDGLHQPDANLNVIENLLDHLNKNGILVIEDIEPCFIHIFEIIEKIFNNNDYKSSLINMRNNGYCLLIQNLR